MGSVLSLIFSEIAALVKLAIKDSIPPLKRPKADKASEIDKEIDRRLEKK